MGGPMRNAVNLASLSGTLRMIVGKRVTPNKHEEFIRLHILSFLAINRCGN